jgi:predicted MFS family arabinose efflux permease
MAHTYSRSSVVTDRGGRADRHGPAAASVAEPASRRAWLAVGAVALATFSIVTVETLPIGLLTSIASGLRVSDSDVGLVVTVTGLVAAASAVLTPVAIGALDRRTVLVGLIALIVAGNALCAASPDLTVLLLARFAVGVSIGGFWSLAAGLAVRLVPPAQVPRAISVIFFGPMAANVLGVPTGTLLGSLTGWRLAFVAAAGLGVLLIGALWSLLPSLPATGTIRAGTLFGQLRNHKLRIGVLATFLLCSGHYGAFTFVSPILQRIAGVHEHAIGLLLLTYGVSAIAGNFLAAAAAARDVRAAVIALSLLLSAVLALFPIIGTSASTGTLLLLAWGLAFGALPVTVQTWVLRAAPTATEAATGLNTCVFNLAIALGALFGSVVAGNIAIRDVLWLAATLAVLAAPAAWSVRELSAA